MKRSLTVVIPDFLKPPADIEQGTLGENVTLRVLGKAHEPEILPHIDDADALMVWHEVRISRDTIARLAHCQIIVRYGVGFDNVDLMAAGAKGIPVCHVPDYGTNDVADHTIALLLHLARGLEAYNHSTKSRPIRWDWQAAGKLTRLAGKTIGIVGLGRIGTAVAMRAKAFGLNVVFYDPYLADGMDKALAVERVELDELLARADIISFHTPLTSETKRMANPGFFSQAKPGVMIINTARGDIMDFAALETALLEQRVSAVGLDVLPWEPPDEGNAIIKAWRANEDWIKHRLVITPHIAFYTEEGLRELRHKAALEVRRVFEGKAPRNCVNLQYLAK